MLRLSPLAFDASTLELWGALLTGATLEVYPASSLPSPSELGAFLLEREVTVAWLTMRPLPAGRGVRTRLLRQAQAAPDRR